MEAAGRRPEAGDGALRREQGAGDKGQGRRRYAPGARSREQGYFSEAGDGRREAGNLGPDLCDLAAWREKGIGIGLTQRR